MVNTQTEENILEQIKENLSIIAGPYEVKELDSIFEDTSRSFQALAITNILIGYNQESYISNLLSSAFTLQYYLQRGKIENNDAHYIAISRSDAFFDAIAGGSITLARGIASLSPKKWIEDGEYEDDFCYFSFLHSLITSIPDIPLSLEPVINRFEECVTEDSLNRLAVCKSFYHRDNDTFAYAFNSLLAQFENERENRYPQYLDIADLTPKNYLFIEGLALLKIAEILNFTVDQEYLFCPSIAQIRKESSIFDNIFDDIDEIRSQQQ